MIGVFFHASRSLILFGEHEPVHLRHVHIRKDQPNRLATEGRLKCLQAIGGRIDDDRHHPPILEHLRHNAAIGFVVVNDKHVACHAIPTVSWRRVMPRPVCQFPGWP